MKNLIKNLIYRLLVTLAKIRLKRLHGVKIIGITGSAGKTTTKDAVYTVLSNHYRVIANKKSYNTEFGMPLTVLGAEAGFSSPVLWAKNIFKALFNTFFSREKVDYFVLEMGVDKPGDMQNLTSIIKPDIAVFTNVKPVHLADGQFKDLEEIFEEKSFIVKNLKNNGTAILNLDDERVFVLKQRLGIKIIGYGLNEHAKLRAGNVKMDIHGLSFEIIYGNINTKFISPILGMHHIYCLLPAIACGLECGMYMQEIAEALKKFKLPPGRLSLIEGINNTTIIDSSYNASPESTMAALDTVKEVAGNKRKIFVFGNMNELGIKSEDYHKQVGRYLAPAVDILVTVGHMAKFTAEEAIKNGFHKTNIHCFENCLDASEFIKKIIKHGDVILVKGSQNKVRLERLVKEIMLHPEMAGKMLCRQEKSWQTIK